MMHVTLLAISHCASRFSAAWDPPCRPASFGCQPRRLSISTSKPGAHGCENKDPIRALPARTRLHHHRLSLAKSVTDAVLSASGFVARHANISSPLMLDSVLVLRRLKSSTCATSL